MSSNTHERVRLVAQACKEVREGVGPNGDWNIDLHQRIRLSDALRCCKLIEEYEPTWWRTRFATSSFSRTFRDCGDDHLPLAAGEEWGQRWTSTAWWRHDIDYNRCTLPNVGGITEMLKIMALCETHVVGWCRTSPGPSPPPPW